MHILLTLLCLCAQGNYTTSVRPPQWALKLHKIMAGQV